MNILLKPVITEKATADSELKNRFTFLVDTNANKVQIKKAVEETYGVSVCLLYTSPSPRDPIGSRMPSSA